MIGRRRQKEGWPGSRHSQVSRKSGKLYISSHVTPKRDSLLYLQIEGRSMLMMGGLMNGRTESLKGLLPK